jgi:hypothetical protein
MNLLRIQAVLLLAILTACSPSPASDAEIANWFEENQEVFLELKVLGEKHPRLHRIEPSLSKSPHHHSELDEDDKRAEQRIVELLGTINADFVVYWRIGKAESGELISISIPYYRWGLALGGYFQSIEYVPSKEMLERLTSATRSYKETNYKGWYIHASDTR